MGVASGYGAWLPPDAVHGAYREGDRTNPHPWSRVIGTCGRHQCRLNWRGEFWDHVPVHGATYLGKAQSKRDAFNRWKNHLMTIGERAEEAVFRDA